LKMDAMATTAKTMTTAGAPFGVFGNDHHSIENNSNSHHDGPMLSWVRKHLWPFKLRHAIATTTIAPKKLP
jgi:hypothetical protein